MIWCTSLHPNPTPLLVSLPGNITEIGGDLWSCILLILVVVRVLWIVWVVPASLITVGLLRDAVWLHPTSVVSHWYGLLLHALGLL